MIALARRRFAHMNREQAGESMVKLLNGTKVVIGGGNNRRVRARWLLRAAEGGGPCAGRHDIAAMSFLAE